MFPEETWIVGFLIGAAFGSFLNVIIYRMPRGLPLHQPSYSFCPSCKTPLGLADLMPLFSWLFSKGRCRHCDCKIPSRYFWVEFVNALIYAGIWWNHLIQGEDPMRAVVYMAAASTLVAIIWIDWEFFIIPDEINAFLLWLGLAFNAWMFVQHRPETMTWGMPTSIAGWITGVAVLWGIAFLGRVVFGKDAMGHGDIKMARGIGAVLGPIPALMSFGLAVALGAVLGIAQIIFRKQPPDRLASVAELRSDAASSDSVSAPGVAPGDPLEVVSAGMDSTIASAEPERVEEEEDYEPESIGSLLKCGLGYLLCIDVIGLFVPKLYEKWFGEPPFVSVVEEEEWEVEHTMIPFGPYLALGAIVAVVFQSQLLGLLNAYMEWVVPR